MGESKLIAEQNILKANHKSNTKFAAIRFGNILLSRGSVVFKFIKQIKYGDRITVTGKNISRFFVSINTAVMQF